MSENTEPGLLVLTPEILLSGQRVRLLAMETLKSKWTTVIVGSRKGRYLVLEVPRVNGLPVLFEDNSPWSVNFIRQGRIYNFDSRVTATIARPFPLVFLTWPDIVETANLRTEKRYPVNIPFIVEGTRDSDPPFQAKGLLLDLSWGGGLAASSVELPEGPLRISLWLDDNNSIDGLMAERKGSRGQQGTYYTGLSFLPNKSEVMDRLGELIEDIENIPLRL
jgi:c-di-GMP-binding flagellar brake protein YcgR